MKNNKAIFLLFLLFFSEVNSFTAKRETNTVFDNLNNNVIKKVNPLEIINSVLSKISPSRSPNIYETNFLQTTTSREPTDQGNDTALALTIGLAMILLIGNFVIVVINPTSKISPEPRMEFKQEKVFALNLKSLGKSERLSKLDIKQCKAEWIFNDKVFNLKSGCIAPTEMDITDRNNYICATEIDPYGSPTEIGDCIYDGPCECTVDGKSDVEDTGFKGCRSHFNSGKYCYTIGGKKGCPANNDPTKGILISESDQFKEATIKECDPSNAHKPVEFKSNNPTPTLAHRLKLLLKPTYFWTIVLIVFSLACIIALTAFLHMRLDQIDNDNFSAKRYNSADTHLKSLSVTQLTGSQAVATGLDCNKMTTLVSTMKGEPFSANTFDYILTCSPKCTSCGVMYGNVDLKIEAEIVADSQYRNTTIDIDVLEKGVKLYSLDSKCKERVFTEYKDENSSGNKNQRTLFYTPLDSKSEASSCNPRRDTDKKKLALTVAIEKLAISRDPIVRVTVNRGSKTSRTYSVYLAQDYEGESPQQN